VSALLVDTTGCLPLPQGAARCAVFGRINGTSRMCSYSTVTLSIAAARERSDRVFDRSAGGDVIVRMRSPVRHIDGSVGAVGCADR